MTTKIKRIKPAEWNGNGFRATPATYGVQVKGKTVIEIRPGVSGMWYLFDAANQRVGKTFGYWRLPEAKAAATQLIEEQPC